MVGHASVFENFIRPAHPARAVDRLRQVAGELAALLEAGEEEGGLTDRQAHAAVRYASRLEACAATAARTLRTELGPAAERAERAAEAAYLADVADLPHPGDLPPSTCAPVGILSLIRLAARLGEDCQRDTQAWQLAEVGRLMRRTSACGPSEGNEDSLYRWADIPTGGWSVGQPAHVCQ